MKKRFIEKGITLVALVVTIITLLILAGVTLNLALSNNGIIEKATYASNTMANATKTETEEMEEVSRVIDENTINLPKEYQRVEYIESTGTQYIDTGKKVEKYCTIILEAEANNVDGEGVYAGAYNTYKGFLFGYSTFGGAGLGIATTSTWKYPSPKIYPEGKKHIFIVNNEGGYIDNVKISGVTPILNDFNYNIYLFKGNVFARPSATKIYKYHYYNSNKELIQNLIPCYYREVVKEASENEYIKKTAGFYDIVEGYFLTNNGTGQLIAGPDV